LDQSESNYVIASSKDWGRQVFELLPEDLRARSQFIGAAEDFTLERLRDIGPDYVFLPHWSFRIPEQIFSEFNCVIFHMTDLPYGRGGSPLQNLILRGHCETKVSALRCVEAMDAGPVYLKAPLSLDGSAREIFKRLTPIVADMIVKIARTRPEPEAQSGEPTEFKRRTPADGTLEKAQTPQSAYDMIRMLDADGYPPAFLETDDLIIEFSNADLQGDAVRANVLIRRRVP
jgi:methionyl-tRNA formyltransferase